MQRGESESVTFVGRFEAGRFAYSGSAVRVRLRGRSVAMELEDGGENRFGVRVDGALLPHKLAVRGRARVLLAEGLADGEHEVELVRLTEPLFGESRFLAVDVDGQLLPPPGLRARRLELIGDSISAGYGNDAPSFDTPFGPDTEHHALSYGALAAQALDADLVTIAWSGKGVFFNAGDPSDPVTMPVMWRRALPEREGSPWDVTRDRPDAVLVNLGTNDLSPLNPDPSPFAAAYLAFVRALRAAHPDALLLCLLGPCLREDAPGRPLGRARRALSSTVDALRDSGDGRVQRLEFDPIAPHEGYGSDFHPSLATHARMAVQLQEALRAQLGW